MTSSPHANLKLPPWTLHGKVAFTNKRQLKCTKLVCSILGSFCAGARLSGPTFLASSGTSGDVYLAGGKVIARAKLSPYTQPHLGKRGCVQYSS